MSDGYYLPQPGTIAARAVDLLHHARAGAELSSSALAEALDVDHTSITPCLRTAVRRGALHVEKRLNVNYWTLGDGTPVPLEADDDPPLQIVRSASAALAASRSTAPRVAVWGDGRLVVERGAQRLEFSPAETREIVAYLASFAQAGEGC